MSVDMTIWASIIIFALYLLISEYFVRKWGIKRTKLGAFSRGRQKGFMIIEIVLMVLFIISSYLLMDYFTVNIFIAVFFTLVYFFRGIEEWVYKKADKGYYHEWLASFTAFVLFILFLSYTFLN